VRTELALGAVASAFEISERMRARQLADLLARGRTSAGSSDPRLIREEENLRRRITELAMRLDSELAGSSRTRGPVVADEGLDELREELAAARAEYEQLLVRLKASRPDYASLITGVAASAGEVQNLLPDNAVLIEYLVQDDWSAAFVVSSEEIAAVELPLDHTSLRQLVELFRASVTQAVGAPDDDLWRTPLRRLYRDLIAPLKARGYLDGRRLLVIAPHVELHYLPFQALLVPGAEGESFLIDSFDIAYIPSASVWTQIARRARHSPGQGLLAMAPEPQALVNSAAEVQAISRGRRRASVLLGQQATERRFRELAPDHGVIHLATFGVLNRHNPLFSYVRLNGGADFDGRLEVHEVFGLDLSADLVVLSACETGLGAGPLTDVPAGDDWVGLVRAFLYAGAESVVASLWPVDDEATARLMEKFYAQLRMGGSIAGALGEAQRALIGEAKYANPYYWAAFQITGGIE
jgi:CHAT domain-containing protein